MKEQEQEPHAEDKAIISDTAGVSGTQSISDTASVSGMVIPAEETERCSRMDVIRILNMANVSDSLLHPEYIKEKDIYGFLDMIRNYFIGYPAEYDDFPDVLEMNAYIRKLSYMLSRAVREGAHMEVGAAIAGICNGKEIHQNLPYVKDIYKTTYAQYFDSCRQYMKCYIALTGISKRIDEVEREVETYKNKLDEKEKKYQASLQKIKQKFSVNKPLKGEIKQFENMTYNNSSGEWSRELHEFYQTLVSLKIQAFNMKYEKFLLETSEKEFHKCSAIREQLLSSIRTSPSPDHVDYISSIISTYKNTLQKASRADDELNQMFCRMKDMNDEMDQFRLDNN